MFFIYQFVIDMNVSRCRGVPAVVSFRLCVDCNKFNQLQAHFPRQFGATTVHFYAPDIFLDVGFMEKYTNGDADIARNNSRYYISYNEGIFSCPAQ